MLLPRLRYMLPPSTSDNSIISQHPCALPCWQNLTTGESTKHNVISFINSKEFIPQWSVQEGENHLRWFWSQNHNGVFYFDNNENLVEADITPNFEFPVQQFFDLYGFPDALSARLDSDGGYNFYLATRLYYPEIGAVIYTYSKTDPKKTIVLDPSAKGYRFVLFVRVNSLSEFITNVHELQDIELNEFMSSEITLGWPGWNSIVTTKPDESLFLDPLIIVTPTPSK
jgi:hypothetical protein